MGKTAKLTVSLPEELILFADKVARQKKTSRSKVVAACLKDLAERQKKAEMVEGYLALSEEQKKFTVMTSGTISEILPEWK